VVVRRRIVRTKRKSLAERFEGLLVAVRLRKRDAEEVERLELRRMVDENPPVAFNGSGQVFRVVPIERAL